MQCSVLLPLLSPYYPPTVPSPAWPRCPPALIRQPLLRHTTRCALLENALQDAIEDALETARAGAMCIAAVALEEAVPCFEVLRTEPSSLQCCAYTPFVQQTLAAED